MKCWVQVIKGFCSHCKDIMHVIALFLSFRLFWATFWGTCMLKCPKEPLQWCLEMSFQSPHLQSRVRDRLQTPAWWCSNGAPISKASSEITSRPPPDDGQSRRHRDPLQTRLMMLKRSPQLQGHLKDTLLRRHIIHMYMRFILTSNLEVDQMFCLLKK